MLFLITQFDATLEQNKAFTQQYGQLHEKLQQEQCTLLLNSEQMEFSVYRLDMSQLSSIKAICNAFKKYAAEVGHAEFLYDIFATEELDELEEVNPDLVHFLRAVEARS